MLLSPITKKPKSRGGGGGGVIGFKQQIVAIIAPNK